jgi:hypothetical protein
LFISRLDFSGLPDFVEPRLKRAVDAEDRIPAFAGNGGALRRARPTFVLFVPFRLRFTSPRHVVVKKNLC